MKKNFKNYTKGDIINETEIQRQEIKESGIMKKGLLLLALCFGIMACGQKEDKKAEATKPAAQEQVQTTNDENANNNAPAVVEEQVTEEVVAVPAEQTTAPADQATTTPSATEATQTTTETK